MTFYTFMMRNHLGEKSPKGALAQEIKNDKERFPKNGKGKYAGWHKLIHEYLENKMTEGSSDVFDECWSEYVLCEKKRLNRNLSVR